MLSQYDQNCPQDGPCGLLNGASSTSDGQTWPLNGPNWPFCNSTCFERPKFVFGWPKIASEWPLLALKWPKLASQWPCGSLNGRSWSLAGSDDLQIVLIGLQMAWEGPNYHVSTPLLRPRFPQKLPGYSQKARGHPWWASDMPQFLWTLEFR